MKIGIIGTGNMGRAIGTRLAQSGYEVFFGARRSEQASDAAQAVHEHSAKAGSNDEAAAFGDILIWTMREPDAKRVLAKPFLLDGKIIIDLNNRDYASEVSLGAWFKESIAERLQASLPAARVVKAFNTIAMESFNTSRDALRAAQAQTFIAGDDAAAKSAVTSVSDALGFAAIDLGGGPTAFRAAEALGDVIRLLMIEQRLGGRTHLQIGRLPEPDLASFGARQPSSYH